MIAVLMGMEQRLFDEEDTLEGSIRSHDEQGTTTLSSPELRPQVAPRVDPPTWLQNSDGMKAARSRLNYDTLSVHILDMGYGPCGTVTMRALDDEGRGDELNVNQRCCSGVLGRLLTAVRRRILQVMMVIGPIDELR